MDKFRRAVVPVLVAVILVAALIYRLSSCAPGGGSAPAAGNSASPSAGTATPEITASPGSTAAVSPTAPYSDLEIKSIYDGVGLSIVEIRDAGDVTMVHYYSPSGVPGEIVSRFDWFDRSTGARELVFGWAYTDKFEIKDDKSFTVLTTGLSHIDGGRSFPKIFTSGYYDIDGAVQFRGNENIYYAPLDKSCTVGIERRECLTGINFNGNFISLGFEVQPGYESDFYAGSESIPKMTVINEAGYSTITLYKTIISTDFKPNLIAIIENAYCRLVAVTCDDTDTTIKLKLNEKVSRYTVRTERSPENDLPYALIEYTNMGFDYPSGW